MKLFIARSERSERRASLILRRGELISRFLGFGSHSERFGIRFRSRVFFYAMALVSGYMVSHMREMFI